MRRYRLPIALISMCLFTLNACKASHNSSGGGGGIDSGGGSGLIYRLNNAVELSRQVLAVVLASDLQSADADVAQFYQQNRLALIEEAASAHVEIKPADQVQVRINGQMTRQPMMTFLARKAPIYVADSLAITDLSELTENILHEYGHHFGVNEQHNEFLDRLAMELVDKAVELSADFRQQVKPCISSQDMMQFMAGHWQGVVNYVPSVAPYQADLTIGADGRYSDSSSCPDHNPYCPVLFYFGSSGSHPAKQMRVHSSCGGDTRGEIDIYFGITPTEGTVRTFELRTVRLSAHNNQLFLEVFIPMAAATLRLSLHRVDIKNPPSQH